MGNNQHKSTPYSNKQFFYPNTSSIAIDTIKTYLGNTCSHITNNAKNCSRSLKYTQDNKEQNCTKFCIENSNIWIKDLFVNTPKFIVYNSIDYKIKYILYQFIKDNIITEVVVYKDKIKLIITENNKIITDIKNISLDNLLHMLNIKTYKELIIQIIPVNSNILLSNHNFTGFKDIRIFKPTRFWDTGYNYPPTISINLENGNVLTPSTLTKDIYGYKRIESKYTVKPYTNNKLGTNKFTSLF